MYYLLFFVGLTIIFGRKFILSDESNYKEWLFATIIAVLGDYVCLWIFYKKIAIYILSMQIILIIIFAVIAVLEIIDTLKQYKMHIKK